MAKQEKELTVEDKLKALYELQTVDSKIDELRILAGELPQEVKDMGAGRLPITPRPCSI